METLQGKIKAVPIETFHKGMQAVHFRNGKWEIIAIRNPPTITPLCFIENEGGLIHKDELKTLVVCYITSSFEKIGTKRVPLHSSYWQEAIDNEEVNGGYNIFFKIIAGEAAVQIPERTIDKKIQLNRLFIQEIINDLEKNGYRPGEKNQSKAYQLLVDWSSELKTQAHTTGKTKKLHAQLVGAENY